MRRLLRHLCPFIAVTALVTPAVGMTLPEPPGSEIQPTHLISGTVISVSNEQERDVLGKKLRYQRVMMDVTSIQLAPEHQQVTPGQDWSKRSSWDMDEYTRRKNKEPGTPTPPKEYPAPEGAIMDFEICNGVEAPHAGEAITALIRLTQCPGSGYSGIFDIKPLSSQHDRK